MAHLNKHRLHYAWVILGAACILNIVSRADSASFGVFIDPLVEQFGWKRGDISFACSLAFIVGLPAVVIMGWLGDRYGARILMLGASVLIGTWASRWGFIGRRRGWAFYLCAVIFGLCYGGEMVGASTGMALGGWLGGGLFDISGDYTWSLLASLLIGCIGLPLALALPRQKEKLA